ncbi:MAG: hypothetical protein ACKVS5_07285 [Parvularculaceae bacterium]
MSRCIEAQQAPRIFPIEFAGPRSPLQLAYVGFFLMFAALVLNRRRKLTAFKLARTNWHY